MTFISYAQNQEDVFLYRAFGCLDSGFYVDIGANDPIKDSVTQAFYERGWQGINVDPVTHWHTRLVKVRPRDINLALAVGAQAGQFEFFEISGTGLSTFDARQADFYHEQGHVVEQIQVATRTLAQILDDNPLPVIHFLKIDVEGAEEAVIRGADWVRHRPWLVMVESTLPNTNLSVHESWEPVLLSNNYHFVWFDGINRFYVADEHPEIDSAFQIPINVLDHFVPVDTLNLRTGARELDFNCRLIRDALARKEQEVRSLNEGIATTRLAYEHVLALTNRRSIRLIRRLSDTPRRLLRRARSAIRTIVTRLLVAGQAFLGRHPALACRLTQKLRSYPALDQRVRRLLNKPVPMAADSRSSDLNMAGSVARTYQKIIKTS